MSNEDGIAAFARERPVELVPARIAAAECHVSRRTIGRWVLDAELNFPAPVEINKRLYFHRAELEAWKLSNHRR
jgi:predicted DNA-binding transcriptional regulator AlpA